MKEAAAASSPTESAPTDCAWRAARAASSCWRVWNSLFVVLVDEDRAHDGARPDDHRGEQSDPETQTHAPIFGKAGADIRPGWMFAAQIE